MKKMARHVGWGVGEVYERCRRIISLLSLLFDNLIITSVINAIGLFKAGQLIRFIFLH